MFTFREAQCRISCRFRSTAEILSCASFCSDWSYLGVLGCGSGHRFHSVLLVSQSNRGFVIRQLHQLERGLGCLILIAAIHHLGPSLPPHVCFDLFSASAVTVKDEGPCGQAPGARRSATETCTTCSSGPKSQPRAPSAGPEPQPSAPSLGPAIGAWGNLSGWLIAGPKV